MFDLIAEMKKWDESKHPRDEDGKFAEKGKSPQQREAGHAGAVLGGALAGGLAASRLVNDGQRTVGGGRYNAVSSQAGTLTRKIGDAIDGAILGAKAGGGRKLKRDRIGSGAPGKPVSDGLIARIVGGAKAGVKAGAMYDKTAGAAMMAARNNRTLRIVKLPLVAAAYAGGAIAGKIAAESAFAEPKTLARRAPDVLAVLEKTWDESEHPRDEDGRFAEKAGGEPREVSVVSGAGAGATVGALAGVRGAAKAIRKSPDKARRISDAIDGAIAGARSNTMRVKPVGAPGGRRSAILSDSRAVTPWTGKSGVEMRVKPAGIITRAIEGAKAGIKAGQKIDSTITFPLSPKTSRLLGARMVRPFVTIGMPALAAGAVGGAVLGGVLGGKAWDLEQRVQEAARKGADMNMMLVKASDLRKFDESKHKRDDDGKFSDKPGVGEEGGGAKKEEKRPGLGRRVLGGLGGATLGGLVGGALGARAARNGAGAVGGAVVGQIAGFIGGMKRTAEREAEGKRSFLPTIGGAVLGGTVVPGAGALVGGYLAHRGEKELAQRGYGPNAARKVDEGELHKMAAEIGALPPEEQTIVLIKLAQVGQQPMDAPIPEGLSKKWVEYARSMIASKDGDDPVENVMTGGDPAAAGASALGLPRVKAKQLCSDVAQRAAQAVGSEGEAYRHGYVAGQRRAGKWAAHGAPEEGEREPAEGEEPEEEEVEEEGADAPVEEEAEEETEAEPAEEEKKDEDE